MATLAPETVGTAIDDYDAIKAVVQPYIDGSATGDATKMEQAFHPDARMFGALGSQRFDVPIHELSWKIVSKTFAHTGGTPPGA